MAKHCIRRWFQFGVLDLLILTTIVAVVALLGRPERARINTAAPWAVGEWHGDNSTAWVALFPDGYYIYGKAPSNHEVEGVGWTLARSSTAQNVFVLRCGEQQFIVRGESGSETLELLNEAGTVEVNLRLTTRLEGLMPGGIPHGTWTGTTANYPSADHRLLLEYRNGELADFHEFGRRRFDELNRVRQARGFSALTERDFPEPRQRRNPP